MRKAKLLETEKILELISNRLIEEEAAKIAANMLRSESEKCE